MLTCIILNTPTFFSSPVSPPPFRITLTLPSALLQCHQRGGFCAWRSILLTVYFKDSFSHPIFAKKSSWKTMWITQMVRGVQKRAKCYQTCFWCVPKPIRGVLKRDPNLCTPGALSLSTTEGPVASPGQRGCSWGTSHRWDSLCKAKNKKNKTTCLCLEGTPCKGFPPFTRKNKPVDLYHCWNRPYCCTVERASWAFGWSGTWGFAVRLPWNCSICCLAFLEGPVLGNLVGVTAGFQGSNNGEETAEALSASMLINKNNPFSLPAWLAASSLAPTLCSYWSLTKTLYCSGCIGHHQWFLTKFN